MPYAMDTQSASADKMQCNKCNKVYHKKYFRQHKCGEDGRKRQCTSRVGAESGAASLAAGGVAEEQEARSLPPSGAVTHDHESNLGPEHVPEPQSDLITEASVSHDDLDDEQHTPTCSQDTSQLRDDVRPAQNFHLHMEAIRQHLLQAAGDNAIEVDPVELQQLLDDVEAAHEGANARQYPCGLLGDAVTA